LASRLDLRLVPELRFSGDRFPNADERIALLLKRAEKKRGRQ
jgi:ribosome-binding factor A